MSDLTVYSVQAPYFLIKNVLSLNFIVKQ